MASLPDQTRALAMAGPAYPALLASGAVDWSQWERASAELERVLPDGPARERRIHHLYVPILLWLAHRTRASTKRPLVAGLSAPQGAGKTTLMRHLLPLWEAQGLRVATVSIDDFYLTREVQVALADSHPGNPSLEHRGYPGTHDVGLGASVLEELARLAPGEELFVPAYDKSAHGGRGDRAPEDRWPHVVGPLDLVILEGWLVGFQPVPEAAVVEPGLRVVNRYLADYRAWFDQLDALVALRAENPRQVVAWRVEAEAAMRASGRPGMSEEEAEDYIQRFLPAYELWAPTVLGGRCGEKPSFQLVLGADRLPR